MSTTLQSWLGKKMGVRLRRKKGIQYEDASWDSPKAGVKHQPWRKILRVRKPSQTNDFVYQRAKARREEREAIKKQNEIIHKQKEATGSPFYDPRLDENGEPMS